MKVVGDLLRRYAALVLIVATLGAKLTGGLTQGRVPVPQVPAAGHVSYEYQLRLAWADDGLEPPFVVQVAREGDGFDSPTLELTAEEDFVTLPPLEPGRAWRWRVVHEGTGKVSKESTFRTADHLVRY